MIGCYGDFDRLALEVTKSLKQIYKHINIRLVFTSLSFLKKYFGESYADYLNFFGIETVVYDFEEVYFKKRISYTNMCMVDGCDIVVCYVDFNRTTSGAKNTVKYAIKKGKKIVNLFGLV